MTSAVASTKTPTLALKIRWVFAIYFVAVGILHFVVPDGLPAAMAWMYELSDPLHAVAGTAEILGGLGLVLPHLVGLTPRLTAAAASGLTLVMVGAAAWHATRAEWVNILGNLVVAGVMASIVVSGWRRHAP